MKDHFWKFSKPGDLLLDRFYAFYVNASYNETMVIDGEDCGCEKERFCFEWEIAGFVKYMLVSCLKTNLI